jgi:hypothetical protein
VVMGCRIAHLPIKYRRIPLSLRRLSAAALQPMVDRIADCLPKWKVVMLAKVGRLALVKSVLAALPLHQLVVLGVNVRALKQVEKILRGFLWVGRKEAHGGHCHVNWRRVCRPLELGGLGIPDLARMAVSLRVRWLWRMRTDPDMPWHGLDMQFSTDERSVFAASTRMVLGSGTSALFWEDKWLDGKSIAEIAPELLKLVSGRIRKRRTFREALTDRQWIADMRGAFSNLALWQYIQVWRLTRGIRFVDTPDRLLWRWTSDGVYTTASCYRAMLHGSIWSSSRKLTWKSWAPPRVKFFIWLACQDRCWTADRLARRGLQHPPRCVLCDQEMETMEHILVGCSYSRITWHEVLSWIRLWTAIPAEEVLFVDWWDTTVRASPKAARKGISSGIMLRLGGYGSGGMLSSSTARDPTFSACVTR